MKRLRFLAILLFCASVVSVCDAGNIIYVDASGPNDPGTGTFDDPFRRIQGGINAAVDGDTVKIRPGLYTGEDNYNLDPGGLGITICSIDPNDPNIIASTIIDPNRAGRGFYLQSGEDANCVIWGLTIRNGHTGDKGGGIFCYNSSPSILNCRIFSSSAGLHGGGLFFQLSNSVITDCIIKGNKASWDGGGIECWSGNPEMNNCIITNNQALSGSGGGIDCFNNGNLALLNCTLVKNTSNVYGGAIYSLGSDVTVRDSILWANVATNGPEVALKPYSSLSSGVLIDYSDIHKGKSQVYDPCGGLIWGDGNINTDPCFASFEPTGDVNLWDFHLQSEYGRWDGSFYSIDFDDDGIVNLVDFAAFAGLWMEDSNNLAADLDRNGTVDWVDLQVFGEYFLTDGLGGEWVFDGLTSPCIDAGDPNSDWSGELWPNGKRINMGAYGSTIAASKNGNAADFDVSGRVDFLDFAELSDKWLAEEVCIVDLTNNGVVDSADLGIFAKNWLWQRE